MQNYYWWNSYSAPYSGMNPAVQPNDYNAPTTTASPSQKSYEDLEQKCRNLEIQNQDLKKELKLLKNKSEKVIKRKVVRRPENQLVKSFDCPYLKCKKEYASTLALNLHIKIKHNGGNKKERDLLAEAIIRSERQGTAPPETQINLPPNYVENYKKQKMDMILKKDDDYEEEEILEELIKHEEFNLSED